jgi:hypothetical protein
MAQVFSPVTLHWCLKCGGEIIFLYSLSLSLPVTYECENIFDLLALK